MKVCQRYQIFIVGNVQTNVAAVPFRLFWVPVSGAEAEALCIPRAPASSPLRSSWPPSYWGPFLRLSGRTPSPVPRDPPPPAAAEEKSHTGEKSTRNKAGMGRQAFCCWRSITCMTNSLRRGRPLSVTMLYSGSFSFLACWIWARRLMGFIPWPYSGLVCSCWVWQVNRYCVRSRQNQGWLTAAPRCVTLIMDLVFFLMRGSVFSTLGMCGSLLNSPSTAAAASFLAIFLLFPSPSPVNSPAVTHTTKLFIWGGPSSFKTWETTSSNHDTETFVVHVVYMSLN